MYEIFNFIMTQMQSQSEGKNNNRIYFTVNTDTLELNVFTEKEEKIKMNLDEEIEFLLSRNHNENKLLDKAIMKRLKIKDHKSIFSFESELKDQYPILADLGLEFIGI